MEDSNKKCGDNCGCGGRSKGCGCGDWGMMGCGGGRHPSLTHIILVIAVLGFVFWWGVKMGEMKSRLYDGGKCGRGGYEDVIPGPYPTDTEMDGSPFPGSPIQN